MLDSPWYWWAVLALLTAALVRWLRAPQLPPGPYGLPLVGYLPWFDASAPHETLTALARRYGAVYSVRMGGVLAVVLSDQRLIRATLAKEAVTGRAPLFLTHGIMKGYGLICAEGDLWRDQRKFVSASLKRFGMVKFGTKRDSLGARISECVRECVEMLGARCDKPQHTTHVLLHCVGNTMSEMVLAKKWAKDDPTWQWLHQLQDEGTRLIGVAGPINFLPFLRFLPRYRRALNFLLDGMERTHRLYASFISEHSPAEADEHFIGAFLAEKEAASAEGRADFYCDQQFHHLLGDLWGAGVDTTITTLRWFFLYMALHKDSQARVQEELDGVVGRTSGCLPELAHLPDLPYTEAALAESQRIRSVVPTGIPHGVVQDTEIGGYHVPKGAIIFPLQWAVHMDPKSWPEPEEYRPERFISPTGHFTKPEAFIPFQTGKRMCVGEELARMLLFLFGATIVHQFHLDAPAGVTLDTVGESGITFTPKEHCLVFTPRL